VILDMEYSRLSDVSNLHADFPNLPIVCTYRVPDDELWIAAIEAGASDVCPSGDVQNVLSSALRSMAIAKGAAA
jgi:DNA-binding NarL/FixJ family response regulator